MQFKQHLHPVPQTYRGNMGKWSTSLILLLSGLGCVLYHPTLQSGKAVAVTLRQPTLLTSRQNQGAGTTDSVISVYGSVIHQSAHEVTIAGDSLAVATAGARKVTNVTGGAEFDIPYSSISEISGANSDAGKGLLILGAVLLSLSAVIVLLYSLGTSAS